MKPTPLLALERKRKREGKKLPNMEKDSGVPLLLRALVFSCAVLPSSSFTSAPTASPTERGWPHYYVYEDGSQCPNGHDVLDEFECYNAFVSLYGHLGVTEHLEFKGHYNVPNAPRGCGYLHNGQANTHDYLINYHQTPGDINGQYEGYVALCRNYDYVLSETSIRSSASEYSHLFNPASQWVSYISNDCGPQGSTFTSTAPCAQGAAQDDVTLEVDKKVLLQVPGPTQHIVPGVNDIKLSVDGCNYFAWTVYHCVLGPNVTHHVVSEVVSVHDFEDCNAACKSEHGPETHGFRSDSFADCGGAHSTPPY